MTTDPLIRETTIRQAHVVATLSRSGGAIVETGDIEFREGRQATIIGMGDERDSQAALEYTCGFGKPGTPLPDASSSMEAYIVIDGKTDLGGMEVRGHGYIGYENLGNFEGWFERPPTILLDEYPESKNADDEAEVESTKDWVAQLRARQPRPSPQYERARRGVRSGWDDD